MTFKLTIEERKARHMMEREKRYDVKVNGAVVDELYYNMTGYRGALMTVHGDRFDVGEKGISTWRKMAAVLNREAKTVLEACASDQTRLISTRPTEVGNRLNAVFGAPGCNEIECSVSRARLNAASEVLEDRIPYTFFKDDIEGPLNHLGLTSSITPVEGRTWEQSRFSLQSFKTVDPDWNAVIIGVTKDAEAFSKGTISAAEMDLDYDSNACIVFIRTQTLIGLMNAAPGLRPDFMRAEVLPGSGWRSEVDKVFTKIVTSTHARPEIILDEDDAWAEPVIKHHGYRIAPAVQAKPDVSDDNTPSAGF